MNTHLSPPFFPEPLHHPTYNGFDKLYHASDEHQLIRHATMKGAASASLELPPSPPHLSLRLSLPLAPTPPPNLKKLPNQSKLKLTFPLFRLPSRHPLRLPPLPHRRPRPPRPSPHPNPANLRLPHLPCRRDCRPRDRRSPNRQHDRRGRRDACRAASPQRRVGTRR